MEMMALFAWIMIGSTAGWLVGMGLKSNGGFMMHVVSGIAGTFISAMVFNTLSFTGTMGFNIWSVCVALIGTVVLMATIRFSEEVYALLTRKILSQV
jgi:uncharacterized membrane protein YeaQ/YmgE (transglycosylase-associated protein family)